MRHRIFMPGNTQISDERMILFLGESCNIYPVVNIKTIKTIQIFILMLILIAIGYILVYPVAISGTQTSVAIPDYVPSEKEKLRIESKLQKGKKENPEFSLQDIKEFSAKRNSMSYRKGQWHKIVSGNPVMDVLFTISCVVVVTGISGIILMERKKTLT